MTKWSENFDGSNLSTGNSVILQGGGVIIPSDDLNAGAVINLSVSGMSSGAAYFIQKHIPCQVNFTKATAQQSSGAVAGSNLYHSIYDINGNLVSVQKFTTVGASPAIAIGTLTQGPSSVIMPTGDYYFGVSIDVVPAATTFTGMQTNNNDLNLRNANGFRGFFLLGQLVAGLMPTSIIPSSGTKNNGVQQGGAVLAVFVEP